MNNNTKTIFFLLFLYMYRGSAYELKVSQKDNLSFCGTWLTLELHLKESVREKDVLSVWHYDALGA